MTSTTFGMEMPGKQAPMQPVACMSLGLRGRGFLREPACNLRFKEFVVRELTVQSVGTHLGSEKEEAHL